jgi:titin
VVRYYIERKTISLGTYEVIDSVALTSLSYQNSALLPLTEYWYRVRACNTAGCSDYSNEAATTTPAPPVSPGAPTGASATAVSSSRIDVTWGAATGIADRYRIERKTGPAGSYAAIDSVSGSSLSYENTGLAPGSQYFYRVQACNSGSCSDYSNETSATTPQALPGVPSGLTATAVSSSRIDLAWSAASGTVSRYRIERKNNTLPGDYTVIDSVAGGTLTYQSTELSPLTPYSYRVQACNSAGCSGYSNEATASTPALTIANAPANLTANGISSTQISLSWIHDGLVVTSFQIERAPGSAPSNFTLIQTVSASARSYVDSGLTGGTTYYYRVRACNVTGCSAWSSVVNDRTHNPDTPSNVTAVAISTRQVTVSWTPPGGQVSYVIRRRRDGQGHANYDYDLGCNRNVIHGFGPHPANAVYL